MKRPYPFNGQMVEGEEVQFETERELFSVYRTSDGHLVRVKYVASKIVRLDAINDFGDPIYLVQGGQIMNASIDPQAQKALPAPIPVPDGTWMP